VTIESLFSDVHSVYVDTAPFIYYVEKREPYFAKMLNIFKYITQTNIPIYTSTLTLAEVLNKPFEQNNAKIVSTYRELFYHTADVNTINITTLIAESAARLRASYNLKTPDALHISTAIETKCDVFLTNDKVLQRISEITIWLLEDIALD